MFAHVFEPIAAATKNVLDAEGYHHVVVPHPLSGVLADHRRALVGEVARLSVEQLFERPPG